MIATVARNILANVAGTGLGILVFLAVVPVYLRLLGAEAYGLIGLLTTVTIAAAALDLGLGATMNRELARRTAQASAGDDFADVAATLQAACWVVGLGAGLLFVALAPGLATRWLSFSTLSAAEVRRALGLMGTILPALVVRGFYVAALNGLQRQALTNVVQVGGNVARGAVTIAALQMVAPTATVFFTTQLILFYLEAAVLAASMRGALPIAARRGRIRPAAIRPVLAFSAGMAGTMVLGLGLMSMDQVILSAILPLAEFGYYTLAVTVAAAVGQVVRPVTTAIYPRFSQLFERGDAGRAADDYHFFSQLVAIVVLPLGALLVFFPGEVLALWTRDTELVRHAALVLSLRTVGTVLNALMHVPHVVQLAFGWSALGAGVNAVAVLVMVPVVVALSWVWGGPGAALAWIALNLGVLLVAMARMHRRVLPGELARWYGHLLLPALMVAAVGALARAAMPEALGPAARLGWLAVTGLVAAAAAVGAAGVVRRRVAAAVRPA
jgi:O-antigen/teichoic acid export membrane protein